MNQKKAKLLRAVAKAASPGGMEAFYGRLKKSYQQLDGPGRHFYEKRARTFLAERGVVLPVDKKEKDENVLHGEG